MPATENETVESFAGFLELSPPDVREKLAEAVRVMCQRTHIDPCSRHKRGGGGLVVVKEAADAVEQFNQECRTLMRMRTRATTQREKALIARFLDLMEPTAIRLRIPLCRALERAIEKEFTKVARGLGYDWASESNLRGAGMADDVNARMEATRDAPAILSHPAVAALPLSTRLVCGLMAEMSDDVQEATLRMVEGYFLRIERPWLSHAEARARRENEENEED